MRTKLFLTVMCLAASSTLFAQKHSSEFGLQTDNDSYLGQGSDKYYTDGLFFFYRNALDVKSGSNLQNKVLGLELGQKIFNPRGGNIPHNRPDLVDRPFAGYLYAGANLNFLYKDESNLKFGAQIGIVGPASGAQKAQEAVHSAFGFYTPTGWEYQIRNDVELNLSAEYNKLLGRFDKVADVTNVDISLSSYVNLGTGFTGAGVGPQFRVGNFNQLFNSAITQSTVTKNSSVAPLTKHEFYFHYRPMINFIGYDATVQGSLFKSHDPNSLEITADPERLMLSNQVGATYTMDHWVFDATATFHTKDVKQMADPHQWGSITALYRFN